MTSPLDAKWHARFAEISNRNGEVFSQLETPSDKLGTIRKAFEASAYTLRPDFTARHLQAEPLQSAKRDLLALKSDISQQESNTIVIETYSRVIDEAVNNLDIVLASAQGNMQAFTDCNETAHGSPNPAIFAAVCSWLRAQANAIDASIATAEIDGFLNVLPDVKNDANMLFPSAATFQIIKQIHLAPGGYFDRLFGNDLANHEIITPAIGDPICKQAMKRLGSDFTLQDSPNGLWSVLASKHIVIRPLDYRMTRQDFSAIVGHEIGSHLAEYVHGSRQPLRLLQTGLDHYEAGNEGRAWLREQIVYDSPEVYAALPSFAYRIALHLAISLSLGYAGKPLTFSELYDFLYKFYRFWHAVHQPDLPASQAHDDAWRIATRVCKGTTGDGSVYRKDIVYLEGNIHCWQLANTNPERIMQGDVGKFDIANPQHIAWLKELQIIE